METQLVVRDKDMKNIVWRSYQYVAMYNVNNKFALTQGGWNTVKADTQLKDHTLTAMQPLGIEPGKSYDASRMATIDVSWTLLPVRKV